MAEKNHTISINLDFPGFDSQELRDAVKAVSFSCDEGVNRLYTLDVIFYIPGDAKPKRPVEFLEQPIALRVENCTVASDYDSPAMAEQKTPSSVKGDYYDGSRRMYYGRVGECEALGSFSSGEERAYHFYRIRVRPNLNFTQLSHPIRTYMQPLEGGDKLTYKDVISKAIEKYNANVDQGYYVGALTTGSVSKKDRLPVKADFKGIDINEDATALNPRFAVQYNESYYTFILRILERQGWHYLFQFEKPGIGGDDDKRTGNLDYEPETVLFKAKQTIDKLGVKTTQFLDYASRTASGLGIFTKLEKCSVPITQVAVKGYDPGKPAKPKIAVFPESDESEFPNSIVAEDSFFEDEAEGKKLAKIRFEELQSHEQRFKIKANLPGAAPGLTFVLHPEANIADGATGDFVDVWASDNKETMKYFITSANHRGTSGDIEPFLLEVLQSGDISGEPIVPGYVVDLECVPNSGTFRPKRTTCWSTISGTVAATTVPVDPTTGKEVAVLDNGMYYITFKGSCTAVTDAGGDESLKFTEDGSLGPVRLQAPMPIHNAGTTCFLNSGTEVIVTFQEGDPDRPLILGPVPNAETLPNVHHNAVTTALQGGLSTRFIEDFKTGNGNYSINSQDNRPMLTLEKQGSLTAATVNTTFTSFEPVAMSTYKAAVSGNSGGLSYSAGASAGFGFSSITSALEQAINIAAISGSINKLNGGSNINKTASKVLKQVPKVVNMIKLLMGVAGAGKQAQRMVISANAEGSNISHRAAPVTGLSRLATLQSYSTKFVQDILKFVEKSKKLQSEGQSLDDCIKNPDYTINYLQMVEEAFVVMKVLTAAMIQGTGNNGILVLAKAGKPDSIREILADVVKKLKYGVIWDQKNPRARFKAKNEETNKNGMHVFVAADGMFKVRADEGISLAAFPKGSSLAWTEKTDSPVAHIALVPHSTEPRINMRSGKIRATVSKDIILNTEGGRIFANAIANVGGKDQNVAQCQLLNTGAALLNGKRTATIGTEGNLRLLSNLSIYQKAQSHAFNLAGANGCLIMAHFDNNNKPISGKPYIAMGITPDKYSGLLNASDNAMKKDAALMKAQMASEKAEKEFTAASELWGKLVFDLKEKDAPALEKAELDMETKSTACQAAEKELKKAISEAEAATAKLEKTAITASAKSIVLANGVKAAEKIEIAENAVKVISGTNVTVKVGGGSVKVEKNKVTLSAGSVNGIFDGTSGTLKLA